MQGWGVSAPVGGCLLLWGSAIPACTEADPPVNRMTDRQVKKHNLLKLHLPSVIILPRSWSEFVKQSNCKLSVS